MAGERQWVGPWAYENPRNCKPSLQARDDASSKRCTFSFNITLGLQWEAGCGEGVRQGPYCMGHQLPSCQQQVPCKLVEPSRVGAGWAMPGRQSPIVLSTAHRFIQEPRVKCTAGSRVDSALNSFGIAGGATEVTWGAGRGTSCSDLGEGVRPAG